MIYLVRGLHQRAHQAGYNHHLINEDCVQDRRPWKTCGQKQIQQQQRGGDDPVRSVNILRSSDDDEPVDIANIKDLPVDTANFGIGTDEFNRDGCLSQIGAHGEVGDGRHQGDGRGDVVKDAI